MFEWLALTLPEERLQDRQIVQSVQYCNGLLGSQHYQSDVQSLSGREIAAVMHAAHALMIYDQRVFAPADAVPAAAQRPAVVRLLSHSEGEQ